MQLTMTRIDQRTTRPSVELVHDRVQTSLMTTMDAIDMAQLTLNAHYGNATGMLSLGRHVFIIKMLMQRHWMR